MGVYLQSEIIEKAKSYAIRCHEGTNHLYGNKPYSYHLDMVVDMGVTFIDLIPVEHRENVIGGLYTHDVQEDCRQTVNDVKKETNESIAELSYALTNEKGRTRAERANNKYYRGIRRTRFAKFCKLADRLANVKHSADEKSSMFIKYRDENKKFIWKLVKPEWYELHQHLIRLVIGHKNYIAYRESNDQYAPMILHLKNMFNG